MKKTKYIQFRVDERLKQDFKSAVKLHNLSMSKVLMNALQGCVNDLPNDTDSCTPMCIELNENDQSPSPTNDDDHLDQITNLDYAPTLKVLLKELSKARHEEYACLTDECLISLYKELYQSNQLHLLFEWEHFDGRIRDEWSGDA